MKYQYLVQKNKAGKIKFHLFTLENRRLTREWGLIGGISQGTYHDYEPINKDKANELTAEEAAEADYDRIIIKKVKEGYELAEDLENLPKLGNMVDVDINNIPTNFCCSKPTQTVTAKAIDKLIKSGNAQFYVKYNGGCHYISIDSEGHISIFTRRWDDHTAKYPSIVKAVTEAGWPPSSLFIVELCIDPSLGLDHMWAFKHFASIAKADTNKGQLMADQTESLKRQKEYPVKAALFGVLYYRNKELWHRPYKDQIEFIEIISHPLSEGRAIFFPQEAKITSGKKAFKIARSFKTQLEGFVLWDTSKAMEVTMTGKPLRRAAWKIKAKGEMDVITYGGKPGKKKGEYGSLYIGKLNDKGEMVPMGTVGGLKPKNGETDPANWEFPCVIEVTYDNIFPDTGYLQFGSFSKIHEDKTPEEVDLFSLAQ